jgi:cutinase
MHNAVSQLPEEIKHAAVGGVLFGDTKNKQENGEIKNYPKDHLSVLCTPEDGVCWGDLNVTAGHMAYLTNGDGPKAVQFLQSKIDSALKAKGS